MKYTILIVYLTAILILESEQAPCQPSRSLSTWQRAQHEVDNSHFQDAIRLYQAAKQAALKEGNHDFAAGICVDIATVYYLKDEYPEAVALCREGLRLQPETDSTVFKLLASLGEMFHQQGKPDSTNLYWRKAQQILDNNPEVVRQTPLYVSAYYGNRSTQAFEQGDYDLTEVYLQSRIRLSGAFQSIRSRAIAENQLATLYFRTGRLAEAENYVQASIRDYPTPDITRGWLLLSAADFYLRRQKPGPALGLLNQAARIVESFEEPNEEFIRFICLGKGQYFLLQKEVARAETELRKALRLGNVTNETGRLPATANRLLSQIYAGRSDWNTAIKYAADAISAVGSAFADESARPSLAGVVNGPALVESLRWKADLLLLIAGKKNSRAFLSRAVNTYQQTFWLTEIWQQSYQKEPSKLLFQQNIRPAYHAGLQALYQQWRYSRKAGDFHNLLFFQEQSKAVILSQYSQTYKLPLYGQNKLPAPATVWQKNLDANMALLHYSLVADGVLLTILRKNRIELLMLPVNTGLLSQTCDSLQRMVYNNPDPFRYNGHGVAHRLYRQLLLPAIPYLNGITRLSIVRDGPLHQLPFEVFETSRTPGSYLIRQFAISYAYSARSVLSERQLPVKTPPDLLTMAPFVPDAASLPILDRYKYSVLKYSRQEINVPGSTVSLGKGAGKQTFLELIPQHNQLHLATHGQGSKNPLQSFVVFFPDAREHRLFAHEIARLPLSHLRLAMLTACQSGDGKVNDSEGLLSLARSFAQAGCKSVITSLWEANDQSTADLSTLFYHHLKQGLPIDIALQRAKLDLMKKEGTNGGFAPPFYWAHLILIGNPQPTFPAGVFPLHYLISVVAAGCLLLAGAGFLWWFFTARQSSSRFAISHASDQYHVSDK